MNITQRLFDLQDEKYRNFQIKLMPTVLPESVIGVRTPALRALAKELYGTPEAKEFLTKLPHKYYDENNLHGFLLSLEKDFDLCVALIDEFLPFVDNWATCDLCSPKVFKKHLPELIVLIKGWIKSDKTYTVRFGIEMLMSHYLDDAFDIEQPELVAEVHSDEYYVRMAVAWYFATALAKQYESVIPFIEQKRLDKWTHNKAISKARDSYRLTPQRKEYLKTLRA